MKNKHANKSTQTATLPAPSAPDSSVAIMEAPSAPLETAIVPTVAPIVADAKALATTEKPLEVIRPVNVIESLLTITNDRVLVDEKCQATVSELAAFISDREQKSKFYGAQARWTWFSIGRLPNGAEMQNSIRFKLQSTMSKSAVSQLVSEANTLCPLIEAENLQVTLSVLKEAKAELMLDSKTSKLLPMDKQTVAAQKLIPLLKSGEVTQSRIKEIRAEGKAAPVTNGHATNPEPNKNAADPVAKGEKQEKAENEAAKEYGKQVAALQAAAQYIEREKPEGKERQSFVNLVTNLCRVLSIPLK